MEIEQIKIQTPHGEVTRTILTKEFFQQFYEEGYCDVTHLPGEFTDDPYYLVIMYKGKKSRSGFMLVEEFEKIIKLKPNGKHIEHGEVQPHKG